MSDSILSAFTATDGFNLALQQWPLDEGQALRGAVLIVHGLGEHGGRYNGVAQRLNDWGYAVRAYDQFGHGGGDRIVSAEVPEKWGVDPQRFLLAE